MRKIPTHMHKATGLLYHEYGGVFYMADTGKQSGMKRGFEPLDANLRKQLEEQSMTKLQKLMASTIKMFEKTLTKKHADLAERNKTERARSLKMANEISYLEMAAEHMTNCSKKEAAEFFEGLMETKKNSYNRVYEVDGTPKSNAFALEDIASYSMKLDAAREAMEKGDYETFSALQRELAFHNNW